MGWVLGLGNGIVFRQGGSQNWSSYWATRTPSTLVITKMLAVSLQLDWLNAGTGYDGTSIERSTDGVTYAEIDTVASGVLTYVDTTITAGETYYYRVRCYKGTNYSPYSNVDTETAYTEGELLIRTDTKTVVWYDVMDLTTITKDGADRVSAWADKLGSGNDLEQANGANQPLWSAGQILGDGVDEFMKDAFTWQTNVSFYAVMKPIVWTNYMTLVDGDVDLSFRALQYNGTPNLNIRIGSYGSPIATTIGSFQVYSVIAKSGDQKTRINKGAVTSATVVNTVAPNGLKLFVRGSEVDGFGNFAVAEIICRTGLDTDTDRDNIIDYLMAKYGL